MEKFRVTIEKYTDYGQINYGWGVNYKHIFSYSDIDSLISVMTDEIAKPANNRRNNNG